MQMEKADVTVDIMQYTYNIYNVHFNISSPKIAVMHKTMQ